MVPNRLCIAGAGVLMVSGLGGSAFAVAPVPGRNQLMSQATAAAWTVTDNLDDTLNGSLQAAWNQGLPAALVSQTPQDLAAGRSGQHPFGLFDSSALTASGIPVGAYRAYVLAARKLATAEPNCHLSWALIAGIGRVESDHGRFGGAQIMADGDVSPSIYGPALTGSPDGQAHVADSDGGRYDGLASLDRAVGPMQFLPATWKIYGGGANPQNMKAAALATGKYLCAGGAWLTTEQAQWAAVYRYNHSNSYVSTVLSLARAYATGRPTPFPGRPTGTPVDGNGPGATTPGRPPSVPPSDPPAPTPTATPAPTLTEPATPPRTPTPTGTGSPTGTGAPTGTPAPGDSNPSTSSAPPTPSASPTDSTPPATTEPSSPPVTPTTSQPSPSSSASITP